MFLRESVDRDEVNRVWQAMYEPSQASARSCPSCERAMREATIELPSGGLRLDGCRSCQLVWFDDTEIERLTPLAIRQPETRELPTAARLAVAHAELAVLDSRKDDDDPGPAGPDEPWKTLPAALGLPVEEATAALARAPWATRGLAIVIGVVSLAAIAFPEVGPRLAFVPSEPERLGGLAFLTSFFVHSDVAHLLVNLYFLVVFGDDVEDLLGRTRFLVLILLAEVGAALGHVLLAPDLTMRVVGASGGISGILAYYAVRLPRARIGRIVRVGFRGRWFSFPAWLAFLGWIVIQVAYAAFQMEGLTSTSAGAHLGGAAVGLALGYLARRR
jgi:Uncharacterized membrane protein (homolog of Drosophila rhomboid)